MQVKLEKDSSHWEEADRYCTGKVDGPQKENDMHSTAVDQKETSVTEVKRHVAGKNAVLAVRLQSPHVLHDRFRIIYILYSTANVIVKIIVIVFVIL